MTVRSLAYWLAAPVAGLLVLLFALPFIPAILLWGAWDALRLLQPPRIAPPEKPPARS